MNDKSIGIEQMRNAFKKVTGFDIRKPSNKKLLNNKTERHEAIKEDIVIKEEKIKGADIMPF